VESERAAALMAALPFRISMSLPLVLSLVLAPAAADAVASQPDTVSEIVVTAQRRESRLEGTPVAVTVAPSQLLDDAGVRDIKDLAVLAPGLLVASTSNQTYTTARIRGVGTVGDNPGLESSVGVVIDGVFRARNGASLGDLGELERIEVIRGPQNTLFGQNTSAGVINVVTRAPSFDPSMGAEATVGEHGTLGGSAFINGPLAEDRLAGRLYVASRRRDGLYDVRTGAGPRTADDDQNEAYETARGQLLFTPSDRLKARLAADFTRRDEHCCVGVQTVVGSTQPLLALLSPDGGVATVADPHARVAWSNRDTNTRIHDGGLALHVEAETPWGTLTSTTAARRWRAVLSQDWDFTSADLAYRPDDGSWSNRFRTFSQELRLDGARGRVDYSLGAYAARETLLRRDSLFYGSAYEAYVSRLLSRNAALPLGNPAYVSTLTGLPQGTSFVEGQGLKDVYRQNADTLALFGQQTTVLTDRLSLTTGLRWTRVEKDLSAEYDNTDDGRACAAALSRGVTNATLCLPWSNPAFNDRRHAESFADSAWSGVVRGEYRVMPGVLTYLSWSRGLKSGGFNLDRAQTNLVPDASLAFPAETVEAVEAGLRAAPLDGRVQLGVSAFHQAYEDFQLNTFLGTTFLVRSIPEVTAKGAEVEVTARPVEGLRLQGGVVYAQTEYGDAPVAGLPRLAGSRLSFAPLWSGTLAATWERPVAEGLTGRVTLAAKYSSDFNTGSDLDPLKVQPSHWVADGRAVLAGVDEAWSLELWATNLFDQEYVQVAFGAPFQSGTTGAFLGAPRTVGLTVRVRR
jgi:outer membrane receptor protein involved in Fe transport